MVNDKIYKEDLGSFLRDTERVRNLIYLEKDGEFIGLLHHVLEHNKYMTILMHMKYKNIFKLRVYIKGVIYIIYRKPVMSFDDFKQYSHYG